MPDWTAYVRERLRLNSVRPPHDRDIVDDLAGQLEEAYRDAIGRGLSEADAVAAAAEHVADWRALSEQVGQSRRLASPVVDRIDVRLADAAAAGSRRAGILAGLFHDLRYAARLARRAPGFTGVAVLMLALGIGANTTIFSWINAILLNPLPGADARRMVDVGTQSKIGAYTAMSYPDYMDLRAETSTLLGLLVHDVTPASLARPSGAERIWVELVSDNFFDVLQVTPIAGRGFQPIEGRTALPVVVISERLALRNFGGSTHPIGQSVDINNTAFTIVGVVPAAFSSGYTGLAMDAWLPIQMSDKVMPGANRVPLRNNHWLDTMGRLAPNVTPASAGAALTEILNRITAAQGATADSRITLTPLWRSTRGAQSVLGPVLIVLMAMVAIVLLIACANVANLLLSRASVRRREFAVRLSLGCSPGRLVRQLLAEAALLVSLAGIAAIVAHVWTGGLLTWFLPPNDFPIALFSHVDIRVALFTAAAAFASALIFGLAPALQAGRTDLVEDLKGHSSQLPGHRRSWFRSTLVVSQMAFSLLLLASAGLFLRSFQNAKFFDLGFKTDHVLLSSVDLFSAGYDRSRGAQMLTQIVDEIRALPTVESASLARRVPLGISTGSSSTTLEPEGYTAPKDDPAWSYLNWVGTDYFRTMGIPVLAGREFSGEDRPDHPESLIVNRTFANRYWPGQNPLGKRIRFGKDSYPVIAVVADSKYRRLNESASPFVYLSTTWNYRPDVTLHIRTATDPRLLAEPVRAIVRRVDARLPVFGVRTLEEHVRGASFQQRLAASLLCAFGALALLLASIGLYATMTYSVSRRTRELGARLALGATRRDILRLVLGQAARLTAIGVGIGLLLATAASPLFSTLLVGVRPLDLPTFAAVTVALSCIAAFASYLPARRAARLDPLEALRYE
jgi:predicted permease